MGEPSPSSSPSPSPSPSTSQTESFTTSITDLDTDALVHCASFLNNLKDISNMAMSCKYLQRAAYSDSIWQSLFRQRWAPPVASSLYQTSGIREAYLARHTALQQFKYVDPQVVDLVTDAKPHDHVFLDKNDIIFSQGSLIHMLNINSYADGTGSLLTLNDHNARVTCMRLFSLSETSLCRNSTQRSDSVLFTSSCDHSIRIWWKGCCQRCFRGHNGPVSTLSDKLLGDGSGKILASGGVDGTVRLWSINSTGKRGQQALKATLYGHDKPVVLMSVAGYKTSLLVSISKNSKVRVWDTTTSSSARSSCCVGMTTLPGAPVGMKCHESLLYAAAGSSVVAIDLRTMHRVFTMTDEEQIYSFDILPSKCLICTGGTGRAMLWDTRRISNALKAKPIAELDGHKGPVKLISMDSYKVVTGGPDDAYINVWEAESGTQTNSLLCSPPDDSSSGSGCSAMAVDGHRIVTASSGNEQGLLRFRDFNSATRLASIDSSIPSSKFWGPHSDSETGESYSDSEN